MYSSYFKELRFMNGCLRQDYLLWLAFSGLSAFLSKTEISPNKLFTVFSGYVHKHVY